MTDTGSSKTTPLYFIAYGWSEGPWHSRKIRKSLEEKGFGHASTAVDADIIIAHSLGCYLIPRGHRAKVIILIGLPYWPGRPVPLSVLRNTVENIRSSVRDGSAWWLNKLLHNLWYILVRPSASYDALTQRRLAFLPKARSSQHILLIRNSDDAFCHPHIEKMLPDDLGYAYLDMAEKLHEDCWLNPDPYVKLIEKYHG